MTEQPGLFDLPDPSPTSAMNTSRDRGRRSEHWTRTAVADVHVVDSAILREAARRRLTEGTTTIDLGPTEPTDDPDLLDPLEEIPISDAAAVRWWIEPTSGIWPQLAEALRLDAVGLDATDESPQRVHARWSVAVTITDIHLLRRRTASPDLPDDPFPELWNRAADPFAPLTELPGATWEPISVEVVRTR